MQPINHKITTQLTCNIGGKVPGDHSERRNNGLKHIQQETEREYITSILKKTKGRIRGANGAAELLNIKPTTLESKMTRLNIRRQDFN